MENPLPSRKDHEDICSWRVQNEQISCGNLSGGGTMVVVAPSGIDSIEKCACNQSSLPRSPLLSMSSAITAASRASPSMTGQMGWSFPEMVKPAAVILLLKLVRRTRGGLKACHPCPWGPLPCFPGEPWG